jgi:RHS repeat-associated protein
VAGQPLTITTPVGTTTFAYELGDLARITDPAGNTTSRFTDAAGRLLAVTTPLGQRTRYEFDVLNRLTKITDPLGGITQFGYDPNGNLLSVTDARNNTTSYAYTSMDRLQTRTDPLTRLESYTYDPNGNLATFTDRKSQVTSRTYDALDRLTQATYADQSTTAYTWDAGNRLTQVTDSIAGTITRAYDGLDRLTQETTPQGSVSYTYDAAGRRTSMTVAGQPTVSYAYDTADRLTSITQGSTVVTYAYDTAGRRTTLTLPNNVSTEYAYDAASRLTGLTYKHGTTTLGTLTYTNDANSQRRRVGGTWARTGLPQAVTSATYNAANHQLTFGGRTLTYDLNGNLTSDGSNTYTWTPRNELAAITGPTPGTFGYDALGRRRQKTITGTTTSFLYDGLNAIQEATGSQVTNVLAALGVDEFLLRADGEGTRGLLSDGLGSTLALTASGEVVTEYTYEPFGATGVTGAASANPSQYAGRENDGTGLYYYRARYYHPGLQRFISEDPIGFEGGDVNLYAYVANNPLRWTDPLGLRTGSVCVKLASEDLASVAAGERA